MLGFDVCKITQVLVLVTITKSCLHMRTRQNVVCYTVRGGSVLVCARGVPSYPGGREGFRTRGFMSGGGSVLLSQKEGLPSNSSHCIMRL